MLRRCLERIQGLFFFFFLRKSPLLVGCSCRSCRAEMRGPATRCHRRSPHPPASPSPGTPPRLWGGSLCARAPRTPPALPPASSLRGPSAFAPPALKDPAVPPVAFAGVWGQTLPTAPRCLLLPQRAPRWKGEGTSRAVPDLRAF